jgi:CRISPR system Cascade subunit CasD
MNILLLRLTGPLISFGAPIVDKHGVIQQYPALSMICGLLGNALGYDHGEVGRLQRLQERIRYASRQDRRGERMEDYQTVNLGADYMDDDLAWTTRGTLDTRKGGSAATGTHIRFRHYWADAAHTVAVALDPPDEAPTVDDLRAALEHPERPLFVGRKTCLPSEPLLLGTVRADGLLDALRRAPLPEDPDDTERCRAWWPTRPDADEDEAFQRPVTDARDWTNQIHVGQRWIASGHIDLNPEELTDD